jgi:hypothetical protein
VAKPRPMSLYRSAHACSARVRWIAPVICLALDRFSGRGRVAASESASLGTAD